MLRPNCRANFRRSLNRGSVQLIMFSI